MASTNDTSKGFALSESSGLKWTAKVEEAEVLLTNNGLLVEFRIDDLIRRLLPNGGQVASCGGCNGCTGCSM